MTEVRTCARFDAYKGFNISLREDKQRDKWKASKPVTHQPIYRGEARQHKIRQVMDILRDWRSSKFEHEASCLHGIRSALCLEGYSWTRADREARELVTASLNIMNAVRPDWEGGQREYVTPRENCSWCGVEIPEELQFGNYHVSFCSEVCAKSALRYREYEIRDSHNRAYTAAHNTILRLSNPVKVCKQCGVKFRPSAATAEVCSQKCNGAYRTYVPIKKCVQCQKSFKPRHMGIKLCSVSCQRLHHRKDLPEKECLNCGIVFRLRSMNRDAKFCSFKCKKAYGFTTVYHGNCEWCGNPFTAKLPYAKCCSRTCSATLSGVRSGRRIPKRMNPYLFDYLIRLAA